MSKKILLSVPIFVVLLAVGALHLAHGDNSQVSVSSPTMVDATGHAISSFQVGQQIGIQSVLTNHEAHDQRFAYIVEAIDKNHVLDYFEGFSASMLNNQSLTATQIWMPKEAGDYTIQVFVWDSLASAAPLSDVMEKQITVQAPEDASVQTTILKSSESTIWFEYTPVCCSGSPWENKYPAPEVSLPEFIKIKDYFNGFGITVIKSMQTHANCDYCTEINGKPLGYSYYLLVPSSDENKMLNLGLEKVDAIPSDVSTAGM